jgi:hypothetical protein
VARQRAYKVFVSYSRHDEAIVKPLAQLLGVAAEDAVFLDVNELKAGDLWEERIMSAVEKASVFVLCWCCESQKSDFVAKEIAAAVAGGTKRLVPVLFCSTKLPSSLSNRQWIDLRGSIYHSCKESHFSDARPTISTDEEDEILEELVENRFIDPDDADGWVRGSWEPDRKDIEKLELDAIAARARTYFKRLKKT